MGAQIFLSTLLNSCLVVSGLMLTTDNDLIAGGWILHFSFSWNSMPPVPPPLKTNFNLESPDCNIFKGSLGVTHFTSAHLLSIDRSCCEWDCGHCHWWTWHMLHVWWTTYNWTSLHPVQLYWGLTPLQHCPHLLKQIDLYTIITI